MGEFLTNTGSVIIQNFITRITGTEIGTIGVATILVASTDVTYTLINVYKYIYNEIGFSLKYMFHTHTQMVNSLPTQVLFSFRIS